MTGYHITLGDGRSTEELMAATKYGYCHSQVLSDNFPARPFNGKTLRKIVLLALNRPCLPKMPPPKRPNRAWNAPTTRMRSTSGSNTRQHSWKRRLPSSMTLGWATMAAATLSASGETTGFGNWVCKGLTTSGRNITGWHSCVHRALTQNR